MHFAAADYDTLVFDCDGVILDSNRIKSAAFRTVTAPFGAEASARFLDYHHRHGGISRNEKFAHFLDAIVAVAVPLTANACSADCCAIMPPSARANCSPAR
jgi:phosphoglycolate phosphatase-like HAD superfamily hydrolase